MSFFSFKSIIWKLDLPPATDITKFSSGQKDIEYIGLHKFYNLFISDTFGEADKRRKIINLLRTNFKRNKLTTIVSKNLFLNLLNVEDIIAAANIILKKNIVAGNYTLKNNKTLSISKIISTLNATSERKMRIKWISNKVLKEKIYNHKALKGWRPNNSGISDIVDLIKR